MLVLNKVVLSDEKLINVRIKLLLAKLKKIGLGIINKLLNFGLKILYRLRDIFNSIYTFLYPHVVENKKKFCYVIIGLNIIALISIFIYYEVKGIYLKKYLRYLIIADVGSVALYYILKAYHYLFGQFSLAMVMEARSREYIKKLFPDIGMWCGVTGAGKDEIDKGVITIKREGFIEDINERLEEIRRICYPIDFTKLEAAIINNYRLFKSSSEALTKSNFISLCKKNNFFFKKYYIRKINQDDYLFDALELRKNKLNYNAKYVYDKGGINKEHFLDLTYQYVMLYIRLNIEGSFIFSNQPVVEDLESGTTARIMNFNFLISKSLKNINYNGNVYEDKVLFPFKDYLILDETEAGTFYNNLDGEVKSIIREYGIRNFKAFNRHMFPHFCWYMIDQDGDRTSKQMEELNHAYMRVINRMEIDGGLKKNMFLKLLLRIYDGILKTLDDSLNKENNKALRRKEKITNYRMLYEATSDEKYLDEIDTLNKIKMKMPGKRIEKLKIRIKKLYERIERNKYEGGYIIKDIIVSNQLSYATELAIKPYSANDLLNHPELRQKSYAIRLYMKKSDCWKYDTHYMKAAKEYRARKSELSLIDVDKWPKSLTMGANEIYNTGYDVAFDMFGITEEQKIKARYKEKPKDF